MRRLGILALSSALAASALASLPAHAAQPALGTHHGGKLTWHESVVDADQSFRGLDAVDRRTAWVAGGSLTEGSPAKVFRTTDGGRSWADVGPAGTEGLMLRDVEATGARSAVVLAIGEGDASRIYHTSDGGRTWQTTFVNDDPAAFYDCMAFYPDRRRGLVMGDPVDGKFQILATRNGGRSWRLLPDDEMPDASGEYGFAASGDCLVTAGRSAYFGTGGADSRIFRSDDFGRSWTATDSGIPAGEAAGVFGLAFRTPRQGIAVGGDFNEPADGLDAVATTRSGRTWHGAGDLAHLGEDVAYLPGRRDRLVVTGESGDVMGTSLSLDGGRRWTQVSQTGFHALDCTADGSCWAAGGDGRVGRIGR